MKEATCNSWIILQFHEAQLAHLGLAKEQPRSAWEGAGRQSLIMIGRTQLTEGSAFSAQPGKAFCSCNRQQALRRAQQSLLRPGLEYYRASGGTFLAHHAGGVLTEPPSFLSPMASAWPRHLPRSPRRGR